MIALIASQGNVAGHCLEELLVSLQRYTNHEKQVLFLYNYSQHKTAQLKAMFFFLVTTRFICFQDVAVK